MLQILALTCSLATPQMECTTHNALVITEIGQTRDGAECMGLDEQIRGERGADLRGRFVKVICVRGREDEH